MKHRQARKADGFLIGKAADLVDIKALALHMALRGAGIAATHRTKAGNLLILSDKRIKVRGRWQWPIVPVRKYRRGFWTGTALHTAKKMMLTSGPDQGAALYAVWASRYEDALVFDRIKKEETIL